MNNLKPSHTFESALHAYTSANILLNNLINGKEFESDKDSFQICDYLDLSTQYRDDLQTEFEKATTQYLKDGLTNNQFYRIYAQVGNFVQTMSDVMNGEIHILMFDLKKDKRLIDYIHGINIVLGKAFIDLKESLVKEDIDQAA